MTSLSSGSRAARSGSLQHEPDWVSGPVLAVAAATLALIVALSAAAAWVTVRPDRPREATTSLARFPAAADWADEGRDELRRLDDRETARLERFEWLDKDHTAARIPIERAMDIAARQQIGGAR